MKPYFNRNFGSDIRPFMLVEQVSNKKLIIRSMDVESVSEDYVCKDGEFIHNDNGSLLLISPAPATPRYEQFAITLRRDGKWRKQGDKANQGNNDYTPSDIPVYHYDLSF